MASDWKSSLTVSARYDSIERLSEALEASGSENPHQEAFTIETKAYSTSTSLEEYNKACQLTHPKPSLPSPKPSSTITTDEEPESPGIQIGTYKDCHAFASGVTSTVYRSKDTALKLIHTSLPPHNTTLEIALLEHLRAAKTPNIIRLLSTFVYEGHQVLAFPYMPLTLATHLDNGPLSPTTTRSILAPIIRALRSLHSENILHRDLKPTSILLASPTGPPYLSDFGTCHHPALSLPSEPPSTKYLDIGTGPYRPPETLFGNRSYATPSDMWSLGVLLSECASTSSPPVPIFESPPTHEDGSQLGLILSIFQTLGTPTEETWPEAKSFRTTPFEMWRVFPRRTDDEIFGGIREEFRGAVMSLLRYESGERLTTSQLVELECFKED